MKNRRAAWVLGALLVLGVAPWLLRPRHARPPTPQTDLQDAVSGQEEGLAEPVAPRLVQATAEEVGAVAAPNGPAASPTNWLQRLLAEDLASEPLPREQIEHWLELNRTNAESLLAARQAGAGREYLLQALTNYPNDPRVLFSALSLGDSAEEKRERLERFKAAAPDNALPDYLSARDHLKSGRPEEAIRDLLAASEKSQFQDYTVDAMQNCEELYLAAGRSAVEAKALGCSSALLPHLSQLKGLAVDMAELERKYLAAGDTASAENIADYGVQLSRHLTTGGGSGFLIDQLVGYAVEQIVLKPLDPDENYDFLQGSVRDRQEGLAAQKAAAKENAGIIKQWMSAASAADLVNYFERVKLYGETAAVAWARQRQ